MENFRWDSVTAGWIEIRGKKLEAIAHGPPPGDAPTIVMLHEGLGCLELWRDFPQSLAEKTGMGVFAWSRAGYGRSDPVQMPRPLDYMTREAMDDLPEVLDAIGFRRGILLGHSDGASIAAIYAGGVEDFRVRGLVLIAPHFFTEQVGLDAIAAARTAYDSGDLRSKLARYHVNVDNAFRGWNDAWLDPRFRDWNIADAIDYWRIPVLAVQGEGDQYGTLAQIDEIEGRIYSPLDKVILTDCRHSPHVEATDRLLDAVGEFAARLQRIEDEPVGG
ncbi:MAG: alpha/beta hydrolase [Nitratireductor sp.]|nr:alpha/beta hydrolase [Nitratireductor sp.]